MLLQPACHDRDNNTRSIALCRDVETTERTAIEPFGRRARDAGASRLLRDTNSPGSKVATQAVTRQLDRHYSLRQPEVRKGPGLPAFVPGRLAPLFSDLGFPLFRAEGIGRLDVIARASARRRMRVEELERYIPVDAPV